MIVRLVRELDHRGKRLCMPSYRKKVFEVTVDGKPAILVRFEAGDANRVLYANNIEAAIRLEELPAPGPRLLRRDDERLEFITTHVGRQFDVFLAEQTDPSRVQCAVAAAVAYIADVNTRSACEVEYSRPDYIERVLRRLGECSEAQQRQFWTPLPHLRELIAGMDAIWSKRLLFEGVGMTDLHVTNLATGTDGRIAMFDFDNYRRNYNVNYLLSYLSVTLSWTTPQSLRDAPGIVDAEASQLKLWSSDLYAYGKVACHSTKLLDRYLPTIRGLTPTHPSTTVEDVDRAIDQIERIAEEALHG